MNDPTTFAPGTRVNTTMGPGTVTEITEAFGRVAHWVRCDDGESRLCLDVTSEAPHVPVVCPACRRPCARADGHATTTVALVGSRQQLRVHEDCADVLVSEGTPHLRARPRGAVVSRLGPSPLWLVNAWRRCRDNHARCCARFVACGWVLAAAEEARKFKAADARVLAAMRRKLAQERGEQARVRG